MQDVIAHVNSLLVSEKQVEDEADTGKYNPSYRESHKDHEQGQVYGLYDVCKRRLATFGNEE